jgi:hypothetical protein
VVQGLDCWQRFDHPEGRPEFHRALFIQPMH